ncbi:hypothetical protein JTE90_017112 [Oedothorax gibbosus]|uniref:Large ribosomal subunit protein bL35m n=1 Tax=Oedothorax gibbosus TaxID=931172 RepID=A0AAV6UHA3_9ARAC|nr:hypothetical protein JTE90_017112 [Oedothorax gibbosus]
MLKVFCNLSSQALKNISHLKSVSCVSNSFSTLSKPLSSAIKVSHGKTATLFQGCLKPLLATNAPNLNQERTVTKFSLKTGKKKSVNAVLRRFYRLECGLWIRRRAGCHSKLHKKDAKTRYNLQQHVFCTRVQCITLDKMITDYHKKPKYYIDDPFEPYQKRNNFDWVPPYRPGTS